jgi:BirA family biotin operon repressor/biotin-[acetyl-CoA-carboxylase] ligase
MRIGAFDVEHHALLGSTNETAKQRAEGGCAHATVIWADEQTAGHGRYGRPWHSPPGNLLFSVVLRPSVAVSRGVEVGFLVAVIVAECLVEALPRSARVALKWPNDVQVDGAKVAGVLPEAGTSDMTLNWIVVGVGLNLAHAPTGTPYPATSLRAHGVAMTPEQALRAFLARLEYWLPRWEKEGFGTVRDAWLTYAPGLGTEVTVTMGDRQQRGVFNGLDVDGAMLLATANGTRRISAGEVAFGWM